MFITSILLCAWRYRNILIFRWWKGNLEYRQEIDSLKIMAVEVGAPLEINLYFPVLKYLWALQQPETSWQVPGELYSGIWKVWGCCTEPSQGPYSIQFLFIWEKNHIPQRTGFLVVLRTWVNPLDKHGFGSPGFLIYDLGSGWEEHWAVLMVFHSAWRFRTLWVLPASLPEDVRILLRSLSGFHVG